MSYCYGTTEGFGVRSTEYGTKESGVKSTVASLEGSVIVNLWFNAIYKEDWVEVSLAKAGGVGKNILLYRGPVSGRDFDEFRDLR